MHFDFATVLIAMLVISSVVLVLQPGDRVFAIAALVTSGVEALIAFRIISLSFGLSSGKVRIDLILPVVLVVAGGVCWARAGTKATITAATVVTLLGALQLVRALHF